MEAIAVIQKIDQKDVSKAGGSVHPFRTLLVSNRNISG